MSKPEPLIILGALITGGLYAYRWLAGGQTEPAKLSLQKLVGIGSQVSPEGFIAAWGAIFLGLSLLATAAPKLAAALTVMIVLGNLVATFGQVSQSTEELIRAKAHPNAEIPNLSPTLAGALGHPSSEELSFAPQPGVKTPPAPSAIKLPHTVDWKGLERLIRSGVKVDVTKAVEFLRGGGTVAELEAAARRKNAKKPASLKFGKPTPFPSAI